MPQNQDTSASCGNRVCPFALRANLNATDVIFKKRIQGHFLGHRVESRLVLVEVWRNNHILALRLVEELAENKRSAWYELLDQTHHLENHSRNIVRSIVSTMFRSTLQQPREANMRSYMSKWNQHRISPPRDNSFVLRRVVLDQVCWSSPSRVVFRIRFTP